MKPTKSMTERLAEIIKNAAQQEEIKKEALFKKNCEEIDHLANKKVAVKFDWKKVNKATNSFNEEYKVEKVNDKEVRVYNNEEDNVWPDSIALGSFNFYYDDGTLVSESK